MNEQGFTLVPCHVCGGLEYRILGVDNGYKVVKCLQAGCGYVFVNPRPSKQQLQDYYDRYYLPGNDAAAAWTQEMQDINMEVSKILRTHRRLGRVLDIGSSYGQFLAEAEKLGWEGIGIEPSTEASLYAREHVKGQIIRGFFEDVNFEQDSFDAVVCLYVLEHVLEPGEFMQRIYRFLKPGGVAVIRVPHSEPLMPLFRLLRRPLLEAPMHLNDFSPHTFSKLSARIGFSRCEPGIGALRRSGDPIVYFGARLLGGAARLIESATLGRYLLPFSGAKQYILTK